MEQIRKAIEQNFFDDWSKNQLDKFYKLREPVNQKTEIDG